MNKLFMLTHVHGGPASELVGLLGFPVVLEIYGRRYEPVTSSPPEPDSTTIGDDGDREEVRVYPWAS